MSEPTRRYYLAETDSNDVLCVQHFGVTDGVLADESAVVSLADRFPEVIYFYVDPPEPRFKVYAKKFGKRTVWRIMDAKDNGKPVAQHESETLIRKICERLNEWDRGGEF